MDWVFAVEQAYVAIATANGPAIELQLGRETPERLAAASGAVASRFLAVGTPRSIGLIGDAALSLEAHRTWFSPRDIRATDPATALATNGRHVPLSEALAADIVCVHSPVEIRASDLRRGTHLNILCVNPIDPALVATIVSRAELPQMAAGFVDGRQLDELTVFVY
ncbi:MAG: hypothetical protein QM831_09275 [Kofleriaceae bacterium]